MEETWRGGVTRYKEGRLGSEMEGWREEVNARQWERNIGGGRSAYGGRGR